MAGRAGTTKTVAGSTTNQLNGVTRESSELSQKLAALFNHDTSTWLLAQADFLVKLAGRKL